MPMPYSTNGRGEATTSGASRHHHGGHHHGGANHPSSSGIGMNGKPHITDHNLDVALGELVVRAFDTSCTDCYTTHVAPTMDKRNYVTSTSTTSSVSAPPTPAGARITSGEAIIASVGGGKIPLAASDSGNVLEHIASKTSAEHSAASAGSSIGGGTSFEAQQLAAAAGRFRDTWVSVGAESFLIPPLPPQAQDALRTITNLLDERADMSLVRDTFAEKLLAEALEELLRRGEAILSPAPEELLASNPILRQFLEWSHSAGQRVENVEAENSAALRPTSRLIDKVRACLVTNSKINTWFTGSPNGTSAGRRKSFENNSNNPTTPSPSRPKSRPNSAKGRGGGTPSNSKKTQDTTATPSVDQDDTVGTQVSSVEAQQPHWRRLPTTSRCCAHEALLEAWEEQCLMAQPPPMSPYSQAPSSDGMSRGSTPLQAPAPHHNHSPDGACPPPEFEVPTAIKEKLHATVCDPIILSLHLCNAIYDIEYIEASIRYTAVCHHIMQVMLRAPEGHIRFAYVILNRVLEAILTTQKTYQQKHHQNFSTINVHARGPGLLDATTQQGAPGASGPGHLSKLGGGGGSEPSSLATPTDGPTQSGNATGTATPSSSLPPLASNNNTNNATSPNQQPMMSNVAVVAKPIIGVWQYLVNEIADAGESLCHLDHFYNKPQHYSTLLNATLPQLPSSMANIATNTTTPPQSATSASTKEKHASFSSTVPIPNKFAPGYQPTTHPDFPTFDGFLPHQALGYCLLINSVLPYASTSPAIESLVGPNSSRPSSFAAFTTFYSVSGEPSLPVAASTTVPPPQPAVPKPKPDVASIFFQLQQKRPSLRSCLLKFFCRCSSFYEYTSLRLASLSTVEVLLGVTEPTRAAGTMRIGQRTVLEGQAEIFMPVARSRLYFEKRELTVNRHVLLKEAWHVIRRCIHDYTRDARSRINTTSPSNARSPASGRSPISSSSTAKFPQIDPAIHQSTSTIPTGNMSVEAYNKLLRRERDLMSALAGLRAYLAHNYSNDVSAPPGTASRARKTPRLLTASSSSDTNSVALALAAERLLEERLASLEKDPEVTAILNKMAVVVLEITCMFTQTAALGTTSAGTSYVPTTTPQALLNIRSTALSLLSFLPKVDPTFDAQLQHVLQQSRSKAAAAATLTTTYPTSPTGKGVPNSSAAGNNLHISLSQQKLDARIELYLSLLLAPLQHLQSQYSATAVDHLGNICAFIQTVGYAQIVRTTHGTAKGPLSTSHTHQVFIELLRNWMAKATLAPPTARHEHRFYAAATFQGLLASACWSLIAEIGASLSRQSTSLLDSPAGALSPIQELREHFIHFVQTECIPTLKKIVVSRILLSGLLCCADHVPELHHSIHHFLDRRASVVLRRAARDVLAAADFRFGGGGDSFRDSSSHHGPRAMNQRGLLPPRSETSSRQSLSLHGCRYQSSESVSSIGTNDHNTKSSRNVNSPNSQGGSGGSANNNSGRPSVSGFFSMLFGSGGSSTGKQHRTDSGGIQSPNSRHGTPQIVPLLPSDEFHQPHLSSQSAQHAHLSLYLENAAAALAIDDNVVPQLMVGGCTSHHFSPYNSALVSVCNAANIDEVSAAIDVIGSLNPTDHSVLSYLRDQYNNQMQEHANIVRQAALQARRDYSSQIPLAPQPPNVAVVFWERMREELVPLMIHPSMAVRLQVGCTVGRTLRAAIRQHLHSLFDDDTSIPPSSGANPSNASKLSVVYHRAQLVPFVEQLTRKVVLESDTRTRGVILRSLTGGPVGATTTLQETPHRIPSELVNEMAMEKVGCLLVGSKRVRRAAFEVLLCIGSIAGPSARVQDVLSRCVQVHANVIANVDDRQQVVRSCSILGLLFKERPSLLTTSLLSSLTNAICSKIQLTLLSGSTAGRRGPSAQHQHTTATAGQMYLGDSDDEGDNMSSSYRGNVGQRGDGGFMPIRRTNLDESNDDEDVYRRQVHEHRDDDDGYRNPYNPIVSHPHPYSSQGRHQRPLAATSSSAYNQQSCGASSSLTTLLRYRELGWSMLGRGTETSASTKQRNRRAFFATGSTSEWLQQSSLDPVVVGFGQHASHMILLMDLMNRILMAAKALWRNRLLLDAGVNPAPKPNHPAVTTQSHLHGGNLSQTVAISIDVLESPEALLAYWGLLLGSHTCVTALVSTPNLLMQGTSLSARASIKRGKKPSRRHQQLSVMNAVILQSVAANAITLQHLALCALADLLTLAPQNILAFPHKGELIEYLRGEYLRCVVPVSENPLIISIPDPIPSTYNRRSRTGMAGSSFHSTAPSSYAAAHRQLASLVDVSDEEQPSNSAPTPLSPITGQQTTTHPVASRRDKAVASVLMTASPIGPKLRNRHRFFVIRVLGLIGVMDPSKAGFIHTTADSSSIVVEGDSSVDPRSRKSNSGYFDHSATTGSRTRLLVGAEGSGKAHDLEYLRKYPSAVAYARGIGAAADDFIPGMRDDGMVINTRTTAKSSANNERHASDPRKDVYPFARDSSYSVTVYRTLVKLFANPSAAVSDVALTTAIRMSLHLFQHTAADLIHGWDLLENFLEIIRSSTASTNTRVQSARGPAGSARGQASSHTIVSQDIRSKIIMALPQIIRLRTQVAGQMVSEFFYTVVSCWDAADEDVFIPILSIIEELHVINLVECEVCFGGVPTDDSSYSSIPGRDPVDSYNNAFLSGSSSISSVVNLYLMLLDCAVNDTTPTREVSRRIVVILSMVQRQWLIAPIIAHSFIENIIQPQTVPLNLRLEAAQMVSLITVRFNLYGVVAPLVTSLHCLFDDLKRALNNDHDEDEDSYDENGMHKSASGASKQHPHTHRHRHKEDASNNVRASGAATTTSASDTESSEEEIEELPVVARTAEDEALTSIQNSSFGTFGNSKRAASAKLALCSCVLALSQQFRLEGTSLHFLHYELTQAVGSANDVQIATAMFGRIRRMEDLHGTVLQMERRAQLGGRVTTKNSGGLSGTRKGKSTDTSVYKQFIEESRLACVRALDRYRPNLDEIVLTINMAHHVVAEEAANRATKADRSSTSLQQGGSASMGPAKNAISSNTVGGGGGTSGPASSGQHRPSDTGIFGWSQWFLVLQRLVLRHSPHYIFRLSFDLFEQHEPLRKTLFYPAFHCLLLHVFGGVADDIIGAAAAAGKAQNNSSNAPSSVCPSSVCFYDVDDGVSLRQRQGKMSQPTVADSLRRPLRKVLTHLLRCGDAESVDMCLGLHDYLEHFRSPNDSASAHSAVGRRFVAESLRHYGHDEDEERHARYREGWVGGGTSLPTENELTIGSASHGNKRPRTYARSLPTNRVHSVVPDDPSSFDPDAGHNRLLQGYTTGDMRTNSFMPLGAYTGAADEKGCRDAKAAEEIPPPWALFKSSDLARAAVRHRLYFKAVRYLELEYLKTIPLIDRHRRNIPGSSELTACGRQQVATIPALIWRVMQTAKHNHGVITDNSPLSNFDPTVPCSTDSNIPNSPLQAARHVSGRFTAAQLEGSSKASASSVQPQSSVRGGGTFSNIPPAMSELDMDSCTLASPTSPIPPQYGSNSPIGGLPANRVIGGGGAPLVLPLNTSPAPNVVVNSLAQQYSKLNMQDSVAGLYGSVKFGVDATGYELLHWWLEAKSSYRDRIDAYFATINAARVNRQASNPRFNNSGSKSGSHHTPLIHPDPDASHTVPAGSNTSSNPASFLNPRPNLHSRVPSISSTSGGMGEAMTTSGGIPHATSPSPNGSFGFLTPCTSATNSAQHWGTAPSQLPPQATSPPQAAEASPDTANITPHPVPTTSQTRSKEMLSVTGAVPLATSQSAILPSPLPTVRPQLLAKDVEGYLRTLCFCGLWQEALSFSREHSNLIKDLSTMNHRSILSRRGNAPSDSHPSNSHDPTSSSPPDSAAIFASLSAVVLQQWDDVKMFTDCMGERSNRLLYSQIANSHKESKLSAAAATANQDSATFRQTPNTPHTGGFPGGSRQNDEVLRSVVRMVKLGENPESRNATGYCVDNHAAAISTPSPPLVSPHTLVTDLERTYSRAIAAVDEELRIVMPLSYGHAYDVLVKLQHFQEVEEARMLNRPSSSLALKKAIKKLWHQRFKSMRSDALSMLTSLVIYSLAASPREVPNVMYHFSKSVRVTHPRLGKWTMAALQSDSLLSAAVAMSISVKSDRQHSGGESTLKSQAGKTVPPMTSLLKASSNKSPAFTASHLLRLPSSMPETSSSSSPIVSMGVSPTTTIFDVVAAVAGDEDLLALGDTMMGPVGNLSIHSPIVPLPQRTATFLGQSFGVGGVTGTSTCASVFNQQHIQSLNAAPCEPEVLVNYCNYLWGIGERTKAIKGLRNFLKSPLASSFKETSTPEWLVLQTGLQDIGRARLLVAGWWQELNSERFWRPPYREEILDDLHEAVRALPHEYATWHAWALMNYRVQQRDPSLTDAQRSMYIQRSHSGFVAAICRSDRPSKVMIQDVLRLMQLWIVYGGVKEAEEGVADAVHRIPASLWAACIPQVLAHLDNESHRIWGVIRSILEKTTSNFPQHCVFQLLVPVLSDPTGVGVRLKPSRAQMLLNICCPNRLATQARAVAEGLIELAMVPVELVRDHISHTLKLIRASPVQRCGIAAGDVDTILSSLFESQALSKKHHEALVHVGDVAGVIQALIDQVRNPKSLHKDILNYCNQLFQELQEHVRELRRIDIRKFKSTQALAELKDLSVWMPGEYSPAITEAPTIQKFGDRVNIIESKRRPRRLNIIGSDGNMTTYCLKGNEDLRIDARAMQLFGLVNSLGGPDQQPIGRFPVIPLSESVGLLGWVDQSDTLYTLIRTFRTRGGLPQEVELEAIDKEVGPVNEPAFQRLTSVQKADIFEHMFDRCDSSDVAQIMWYRSMNAELWLKRRCRFTASVANMSMVGYILGLGDRHPGNLLVQVSSGMVVHIDFGDCFDVGRYRDLYPETVPFRLTPMLINAMEVFGVSGLFQSVCERSLQSMRKNRDSIVALLAAFVYDPVMDKRITQQHKGNVQSVIENVRRKLRGVEMPSHYYKGNQESIVWDHPVLLEDFPVSSRHRITTTGGNTTSASTKMEPPRPRPHVHHYDPTTSHHDSAHLRPTTALSPLSVQYSSMRLEASVVSPSSPPQGAGIEHSTPPPSVTNTSPSANLRPKVRLAPRHDLPFVLSQNQSEQKMRSAGVPRESLPVPTQVHLLIAEATSSDNLSQVFPGWTPWW